MNINKYQFDEILKELQKKSPAKFDVLQKLLVGLSETEIAQARGKAQGTVRKQVSDLYVKFKITRLPGTESHRDQLIELFTKHKPEWIKFTTELPKSIPNTPLTGVVPPDDPRYLEREADRQLINIFSAHNDESSLFIRIRGSKGMGKSSLLARLRQFLEHIGHNVSLVELNGQTLRQEALNNLDTLLYDFTYAVAKEFENSPNQIDLKQHLKTEWDKDIASGISCTEYLNNHIFSQLQSPKTLVIDNVDYILGHELVQTKFLDVIRSWHERRMKKTPNNQCIIWPHIVIAYSTDPYIQYDMTNSPLNIGISIELEKFTEEQALQQAKKYGLDWTKETIKPLMNLINGQPELVNRVLYKTSQNNMSLDEVISQAEQPDGLFSDYLLKYLKDLKEHPNVLHCLQKILNGEECYDDISKIQLLKAGIIQLDNFSKKYCASCQLYQKYFKRALENHNGI